MSQTVDTENAETRIIINLPTPMFQAIGGQLYKLLLETTAAQVKMSDGIDLETRVNTIERALAANTTLQIVESITARDSLTGLHTGDKVLVLDATEDETVNKGGATYVVMSDMSFRKIAEDESMDIICDWNHIENKPQSSTADIDLAVASRHNHNNKTELDNLTDDGAGNLLFNGKRVWDGKVDVATVTEGGDIPDNLRDGGLIIVKPA